MRVTKDWLVSKENLKNPKLSGKTNNLYSTVKTEHSRKRHCRAEIQNLQLCLVLWQNALARNTSFRIPGKATHWETSQQILPPTKPLKMAPRGSCWLPCTAGASSSCTPSIGKRNYLKRRCPFSLTRQNV